MPKSSNQKLKLLYLLRLFLRETDSEHVVSMKDIIRYLEKKGVHAERKSIYDDIEVLRQFGMDIQNRKERPAGYYLESRLFCEEECAILLNLVQSTSELTGRKARELTRKIEQLIPWFSEKRSMQLIHVSHRIHTMEDSIYQKVDLVRKAMDNEMSISFRKAHLTEDRMMHRYGPTLMLRPEQIIYQEGRYQISGHTPDMEPEQYYLDEISYLQVIGGKTDE